MLYFDINKLKWIEWIKRQQLFSLWKTNQWCSWSLAALCRLRDILSISCAATHFDITHLNLFRTLKHLSHLMTNPTKWHVRPAKTQISLGILPVWSETSLSAWWKLGPLATHWSHSEDSDQTERMPRLIWVFARRTDQFVDFVTSRLTSYCMPVL